MAISQAMCTSFKVEILDGIHAFGTTVVRAATTADTFKIALYTSSATLSAATTAYTTSNEVPSTGNYTAGGNTLTVSQVPTSTGTTALRETASSFIAKREIPNLPRLTSSTPTSPMRDSSTTAKASAKRL